MAMDSSNNNIQRIVIPQTCACCAAADGCCDVAIYSSSIGEISQGTDLPINKGTKYITFNVKICNKCVKMIKNKSITAASMRLLPFVLIFMIILFSFSGRGNILYILLGLVIFPFILGYRWIIGNDITNSKKYIGSLTVQKSGEIFNYDAVFVNKEYEEIFKAANDRK